MRITLQENKRAVLRSDIDLACYHVVGIIQIPASVKLQVTLYIMDLWCQKPCQTLMCQSQLYTPKYMNDQAYLKKVNMLSYIWVNS